MLTLLAASISRQRSRSSFLLSLRRQRFLYLCAVIDPVRPLKIAGLDVHDQCSIEQQRLVFLNTRTCMPGRPLHIKLPFLDLNFRPINLLSRLMKAELFLVLCVRELGIGRLVHPSSFLLLLSFQWLCALRALFETSVYQCVICLVFVILKIALVAHLNTVPDKVCLLLVCVGVIMLLLIYSSRSHGRFVQFLRDAAIFT